MDGSLVVFVLLNVGAQRRISRVCIIYIICVSVLIGFSSDFSLSWFL